jgi:hypothetical protein
MADRGHSRDGAVGWWIAGASAAFGDGHGAGIELTETALLLAMVAWR